MNKPVFVQKLDRDGVVIRKFPHNNYLEEDAYKAIFAEIESLQKDDGAARVALDFSQVNLMWSTVLGKLCQLHIRCKERQGCLLVVGICEHIMEVFRITRLNKTVKMADAGCDPVAEITKILK